MGRALEQREEMDIEEQKLTKRPLDRLPSSRQDGARGKRIRQETKRVSDL